VTEYRKLDALDKTIKLTDGRKLGFREYGNHKGKPLFFFHGWPSSRFHGSAIDDTAKELGIRVISVDRPGMGLSDFQPNRKLLDWPNDLLDLANQLKINKFSVIGVSGGGPYSAVCAYKIPERLYKVGIVVGLAPTCVKGILNGMGSVTKIGWMSYSWSSVFAYIGTVIHFITARYFHSLIKLTFKSDFDRKLIPDEYPSEAIEPFRQGVKGSAQELSIYSHGWGFSVKDIKMKVALWYGEKDKNVPLAMAKYYENNIPNNKLVIFKSEGHLIIGKHAREILTMLV
jgi:pimeloyl-ACP methyl ester carboxylesterase